MNTIFVVIATWLAKKLEVSAEEVQSYFVSDVRFVAHEEIDSVGGDLIEVSEEEDEIDGATFKKRGLGFK